MPTNLDRAGLIARMVQLESVTLHRAEVTSNIDPLAAPEDLRVIQGYRAGFELPEQHPEHAYVTVEFQLTASDAGAAEPETEALSLHAAYLLVYRLEAAREHPVDALEHFAELNGTYNAWPYWRELVQTVTGRVGLNAIVVPVFRPAVREIEDPPLDEAPPAPRRRAASRTKPAA